MPAAEPPLTWLAPQTDVLLVSQTPVVHVHAETGGGEFRKTMTSTFVDPTQLPYLESVTARVSRKPRAGSQH